MQMDFISLDESRKGRSKMARTIHKKYTLNFYEEDKALYEEIVRQAAANRQSLSGYIMAALEDKVGNIEEQQKPAKNNELGGW